MDCLQDMPALFWDGEGPPNFTPAEKAQWEGEMRAMIEWHVSFPCIIMWVVFNEGWGQYETERVVQFGQVCLCLSVQQSFITDHHSCHGQGLHDTSSGCVSSVFPE